jgi:hypothetical protein
MFTAAGGNAHRRREIKYGGGFSQSAVYVTVACAPARQAR